MMPCRLLLTAGPGDAIGHDPTTGDFNMQAWGEAASRLAKSQFSRIRLMQIAVMTRDRQDTALAVLGLVAAGVCCVLGSQRFATELYAIRGPLLPALIAVGAGLAWAFRPTKSGPGPAPPPPRNGNLRLAAFVAALLSLAVTTGVEAQFRSLRQRVLDAPAADLARVGRHVIVGIDEIRETRDLVDKGAVAGLFFTGRNVKRRSIAVLHDEIARLQELQSQHMAPRLWIAADQEGGAVEQLSPPLPSQPSLARILRDASDAPAREAAVRAYATAQARALVSIGVNVNFAPVVDVDFNLRSRSDGKTHITSRTISSDAGFVARVALWYCDALFAEGVRCTRKHFPGLGRVSGDTHAREATLGASLEKLAASDWLPFDARVYEAAGHRDWIMLGHARLDALDPFRPASASPAVVAKLRDDLGHDGVLVTDDFSMGAIRKSHLRVAGAAVEALNAGIDLILVSYDTDQVYIVLDALLTASAEGRLDEGKSRLSDERLRRSAEASFQARMQ